MCVGECVRKRVRACVWLSVRLWVGMRDKVGADVVVSVCVRACM
jgi:hypothetical protein